MGKIIIRDDESIENLEIKIENFLPNEKELQELNDFKPLSDFLYGEFAKYPPYLISTDKHKEAFEKLFYEDEISITFKALLAKKNHISEVLEAIIEKKELLTQKNFIELLLFLFPNACENSKQKIIEELKKQDNEENGFALLTLALYSKKPIKTENLTDETLEFYAVNFLNALKEEKQGNPDKAFEILIRLLKNTGFSPFIYELMKLFVIKYSEISPQNLEKFISIVEESTLHIPFEITKFIKFLFYYKNNLENKLENSLIELAESTKSLFVLHMISPLLFKYKKWHLVGKFFKIASNTAHGKEKIKYLTLLADIYENKLMMPEFAIEIYKKIVEENPHPHSVSLAKVIFFYEENEKWNNLFDLYVFLGEKESVKNLKAYYFYKAGDISYLKLHRYEQGKKYLEKSIEANFSFETVRELSELYQRLHEYTKFVELLKKELKFSKEKDRTINILFRIAETLIEKELDYKNGEHYLLEILKLDENNISALKKLGKLYYITNEWEKLIEINNKEILISDNMNDIVNLLYKNGTIYYNHNKYKEAKKSFMEILEFDKSHIPSMLFLEKIHIKTKNSDDLIELYEKMLSSASKDDNSKEYYLEKLAQIYRDKEETEKSLSTLKTLKYLFPENHFATENIRLLHFEPDFSPFKLDEFESREFEQILNLAFDKVKTDKEFKFNYFSNSFNDFWKFLYDKFEFGKNVFSLYSLDKNQKFIQEFFDNELKIDTLLENKTYKVSLLFLAKKYLEKKYYPAIATLINNYIKLEPKEKRNFWALFFIGSENHELKEQLESLLVSVSNPEFFRVIFTMLEKLYEKEKNYSTILFIRMLFAKKIKDYDKKIEFIDKTIEKLSSKLQKRELTDLYIFRYKTSNDEDKQKFFPKYKEFLENLGKKDVIISVYKERWEKFSKFQDGIELMSFYNEHLMYDKSLEIVIQLLQNTKEEENIKKFVKELVKITNIVKREDIAINEIEKILKNQNSEELKLFLYQNLFDLSLQSELPFKALKIFEKDIFKDTKINFEKGLKLAQKLIESGEKANAVILLFSLNPDDKNLIKQKIGTLISLNEEPSKQDLEKIEFGDIATILSGYKDSSIAIKIMEDLAEKGDKKAKEALFKHYLEKGEIEKCKSISEQFGNTGNDSSIMRTMILRTQGKVEEEIKLLLKIAPEELKNGSYYPYLRILDFLTEKKEKRSEFFVSKLLSFFDSSKFHNENNKDFNLFPINQQRIFDYLQFSGKEKNILDFAKISTRKKIQINNRLKNITNIPFREIEIMVERIKMATNNDFEVYFSDEINTTLEIFIKKIPFIVLGNKAKEISKEKLQIVLMQHLFLMQNGMDFGFGKTGLEKKIEKIETAIKLSGKNKVAFINSVQTNFQQQFLELFNTIEKYDKNIFKTFVSKLYTASIIYAFALLPDISLIVETFGNKKEDIFQPTTFSAQCFNFANNEILKIL